MVVFKLAVYTAKYPAIFGFQHLVSGWISGKSNPVSGRIPDI
jgi:hypothetical protein